MIARGVDQHSYRPEAPDPLVVLWLTGKSQSFFVLLCETAFQFHQKQLDCSHFCGPQKLALSVGIDGIRIQSSTRHPVGHSCPDEQCSLKAYTEPQAGGSIHFLHIFYDSFLRVCHPRWMIVFPPRDTLIIIHYLHHHHCHHIIITAYFDYSIITIHRFGFNILPMLGWSNYPFNRLWT